MASRPPARRPRRPRRGSATAPGAGIVSTGATTSTGAVAGLAPLLISGLALLMPDPANTVPASSPNPAAVATTTVGGTTPAGMAADGDLPSPPRHSVPDGCLDQFVADLPFHRGDDVRRRQTIICRRGYVLSFNIDTRSPDWVMERLEPADLRGSARRGNRFLHDPSLPAGIDADNADYLRTGFDRGHQAPAANAKFDQTVMDESFFFTNMSPQRGIGMNRGAWKFLEEATRSWVLCGGHPDLYVITGPIYGSLDGNPATIGDPPVAVPRAFYKIVYDPNMGRAVGFVLPNTRIGSRIDLQNYVVSIADIETETGLNFFRSMSQREQTEIKDGRGVAWRNSGPCPGDAGD